MNIGDTIEGTISYIKDFGIILSFEGYNGMIYYKDIVPRVEYGKIGNTFSTNQTIKAKIKEIKDDGKIYLTMRQPNRQTVIRKVKEEVKKLDNEDANEDTNIRSVWKILTEVQYYMLRYYEIPIRLKKETGSFDEINLKFTIEVDTESQFDNFCSEVRRVFSTDVLKHPKLPDTWYFIIDADLYSQEQRNEFADMASNLFIKFKPDPIIEIEINVLNKDDKNYLNERLLNYFPQIQILKDDGNEMIFALSYTNHQQGESKFDQLEFALAAIKEGVSDSTEDGKEIKNEKIDLSYNIKRLKDNNDVFLLGKDAEDQIDKESTRLGNLRGQSFVVISGKDDNFKLGKLYKINYPELTFSIDSNDSDNIIANRQNICRIIPDMDDLTGEVEKVNRLRDSFNKITSRPEDLVNPNLATYLFDASKATPLDNDTIEKRKSVIKDNQLNSSLNESQIDAIAKAVEAQDLALIQGPPGTGKSTAIAELIWQLTLAKPNTKILLTSEANLAVDNALNRLKYSIHNLVKPIRIASGEKFSAEGLPYSITEMKRWAGIDLSKIEKEDDDAIQETEEYKNYDPSEMVLNRWLINIYKRNALTNESERKLWYECLSNPSSSFKEVVYDSYIKHCNVIGATCSAISETNYSATEALGKHTSSRFLKKYQSIFGEGQRLKFDTVIQDEASKATPAELSLPLVYGEKAVVIGDHRQLPPNLDKEDILYKLHIQLLKSTSKEDHDKIQKLEKYVRKHFDILEKSHFERLFNQIDPSLKGTFNLQYRMHPDINEVIRQFYMKDGGDLKCGFINEDYESDNGKWFSRYHGIDIPGLISPQNHIIWIDTRTPEIRDGSSRANRGEIEAVEWVLRKFEHSSTFKNYVSKFKSDEDKEIGLITFYGAQLRRLRYIVDPLRKNGLKIKLSSVDRFQGMERNIIIVSLVRSNCIEETWKQIPDYNQYGPLGYPKQKDLGFAKSPNRLNVALSRAKSLLIIIGNSQHFSNYVDKEGNAIYKNVFQTIENNPNGRIIPWKDEEADLSIKVRKVPMPKNRSLNLNTRDININTDTNLRIIDTWFTKGPHPVNPHFAVLELSTKAVKLLIGKDENLIRNSNNWDFQNFYREAQKTETGKGLNDQNEMDMDYFDGRVMPVILRMKSIMRREEVDVVYTVATAAYRTARNRDQIIETIRKKAGINVRILSKKEESIATMFAYSLSSKYKSEMIASPHVVMIDQGGGSTEVSVFNHGELIGSYSINLGTTALRNMLSRDSSPETTLSEALRNSDQMLRERLVAFYKNMGNVMESDEKTFCVSVGSAITKATGKKGNKKQHDTIIPKENIKEKIDDFTAKLTERFPRVSDLINYDNQMNANDEIDSIITMRVGLPMYLSLMDKFNIEEIHVCGTGLWYGIYLQHLFNFND